MRLYSTLDVSSFADARVVLLDADGTLFPSEEPAFAASAGVTNEFLRSLGVRAEYSAEELRRTTTGLTFRTTAVALARKHGVPIDEILDLDAWVAEERRVVTAHLALTLRPDPVVKSAVAGLARRFELAVVTSSALGRLDACLGATGLSELLAPELRFSAEDSLPTPSSKPDPAIYRRALDVMAVDPAHAVAIEDSVVGARSAIAAGILTLGNLAFTSSAERAMRTTELRATGVIGVSDDWSEIRTMLESARQIA